MRKLNFEEICEAAEQYLSFNKTANKKEVFIAAVKWKEMRDRCREKPHVAEVVKCGQVNKPEDMISYPKMLYPEYLPKKYPWDNPLLPDPNCKHENGPLIFSQGYTCVKCNAWITYPKIEKPKCDHVASSQSIAKDGGYMCVKCGKWVNLFD